MYSFLLLQRTWFNKQNSSHIFCTLLNQVHFHFLHYSEIIVVMDMPSSTAINTTIIKIFSSNGKYYFALQNL